jgi:dienelactone hydrolase
MAKTVIGIDELRSNLNGAIKRADHHAGAVKDFVLALLLIVVMICVPSRSFARAAKNFTKPEIIHFQNQNIALAGELFKPRGNGPFPAILYNHGSAPGMLNSQASKVIGPLFAEKGWVFFMPYRRGQGLSAKAGPYIGDELKAARKRGGETEGFATMVALLSTDHLEDQLAAYQWLTSQKLVQTNRVAVAGNSFGGIETVLGAAQTPYCAAVDASGGAETWSESPDLQNLLKAAVRKSNAPIFFFQAENDFDLSPSKVLFSEMKQAGKEAVLKIYPPYGSSSRDGHSFAYLGSATWFNDVFSFIQKHCADETKK